MEWRKPFQWEHLLSSLSSKRRVVSGFGLGVVVASLVVVSFLLSVGAPPAIPSSLFFWLSSVSGGATHFETTHHPDPPESPFLVDAPRNSTAGDGDRSYLSSPGHPAKADGESSSKNYSSGGADGARPMNNAGNFTEKVESLNNTVKEPGVLEETHIGNSSKNSSCEGSVSWNNATAPSGGAQVVVKNTSRSGDGAGVLEKEIDSASDGSGSAEVKEGFVVKCDIFDGRWVQDERKPYYRGGSCPYIDTDFDCHKNGRPDDGFLRWRWQPYGCNIPRLNATDFLERLRGKRIIFVGDSLNRNMWESLVCILRDSVKHKKRVYEVLGRKEFKTRGYYAFRFEDYNCSVDFVRSPFLVRETYHTNVNGTEDEKLRLDLLDETTSAYTEAEIVVFNTGHWWTHEKTSRGIDYYQEGNFVYPVLKVMEAYKKALNTWARWVDTKINSNKTRVVFRGYSLTHFRGGQWNSGGQCHKESEPIFNESFLAKYPSKMRALEQVLGQMRTPVVYLNISRLTDYRKDGHPSIYRKTYQTVDEQIAAEKSQDCSHWCLPGIPDTWNELLYASLLNK